MKSTAPLRTSVWPRQHPALLDLVVEFILAVAFEFSQAIMAARRYEQLRLEPRACHDPARRVFLEFYSNR